MFLLASRYADCPYSHARLLPCLCCSYCTSSCAPCTCSRRYGTCRNMLPCRCPSRWRRSCWVRFGPWRGVRSCCSPCWRSPSPDRTLCYSIVASFLRFSCRTQPTTRRLHYSPRQGRACTVFIWRLFPLTRAWGAHFCCAGTFTHHPVQITVEARARAA